MKKYEYKIKNAEHMTLNDLNNMGDLGWILCHVTGSGRLKAFVFYREKTEEIEEVKDEQN